MEAERLSEQRTLATQCCIVGGGPAGMMLALLLARAGVDVVLLEKHRDFFRDFRGDTIHPSTIDLIDQLGLRERFDAITSTDVRSLDVVVNGTRIRPVDFRHLRGRNRHITLMPQWDFLDLLADAADRYPNLTRVMGAEVTGITRERGSVTGVVATVSDASGRHSADGVHSTLEVRATLTVAADGRASVVRAVSGLPVRDFGVPIDVLWFRLPRPARNPPSTLGYIRESTMVVTIPRTDYYQAAMLIPKGSFDEVKDDGLPAFRQRVTAAARFLGPVIHTLTDFDQVKLLSVQVNRLDRWYQPGLLCIGDAAHAMSPAFGVGINYAIQDAVAAANLLAAPLASSITVADLAAVQRRRARPVALMQPVQLALHRLIASPTAAARIPNPLPFVARLVITIVSPVLRRITARIVGRGFRPERIRDELLR